MLSERRSFADLVIDYDAYSYSLSSSSLSFVAGPSIRLSSLNQEPRSVSLQRSLQKGNVGMSLIEL